MNHRLLSREFLAERFVPELEMGTVQYFDHFRLYLFAQVFVYGQTVLDIACGSGFGSNILRLGGAEHVFSVNLSREALAYAATHWRLAGLMQADAHTLPLKSSFLDVIICFETLEQLLKPTRFLREAAHILKPNGDLILSTPNRNFASPGSPKPFSPYHTFEPTRVELQMLLEETGWTIIEMRGIAHSPAMAAVVSTATKPYFRLGKGID